MAGVLSTPINPRSLPSLPFMLPREIFEKVVNDLDPIDIFNFSLISKTCTGKMRDVRIKTERLQLEQDSVSYRIKVVIANRKPLLFEFKQLRLKKFQLNTMQLFGEAVQFCDEEKPFSKIEAKVADCKIFYYESEIVRREKYLEMLMFIVRIFKHDIRMISDDVDANDIVNRIKLTGRQFEFLQVTRSQSESLNAEDLFPLLEIRVTGIHFLYGFASRVRYTGRILSQHMLLLRAEYLTIEALLNMQCETINVGETKFEPQDLLALISKWQRGDMPQLKRCHITQRERFPENIQCGGIRWTPPLKRLLFEFPYPDFGRPGLIRNRSNGMCSWNTYCIRGHDGTLALMETGYDFKFYVVPSTLP